MVIYNILAWAFNSAGAFKLTCALNSKVCFAKMNGC